MIIQNDTKIASGDADSNFIVLAPIFMEAMGSVFRNYDEKWIPLVLALLHSRKLLEYQPIMWLI